MSLSFTKRIVVGAGALSIVFGCCLAAVAATQYAYRLNPQADIGVLLQTVSWEQPDPGLTNWQVVGSVRCRYYWDWIPSTNWPNTGSPPVSWKMKTEYATLASEYDEVSYYDTYSVTVQSETSYTAMVELKVTIKDTDTNEFYECNAFSYQGTDAYNNLMQHYIYEADWTTTPVSP